MPDGGELQIDAGRRGLGRTGWLVSLTAGGLVALLITWLAIRAGSTPSQSAPAADSSSLPVTPSVAPTASSSASVASSAVSTTTTPVRSSVVAVPPAPGVSLGGCPNLPADNVWHADVSRLPVNGRSAQYVASIGASAPLKADFGSGLWDGGPIGIPITYTTGTAKVAVSFDYDDESDPGPYPIPKDAAVEGGPGADGDRHVLVVDTAACRLYELYDAHPNADGSWHAGSGAVYDLRSDRLRPAGWTSADAAGLPVSPGLVRYDEVAAGHIDHAIRVTVPRSQRNYLWPARHAASSSSDPALPPMGLRLRLKPTVDTSKLPAQARIIAEAMKTHGVIVADNGSAWYLSGAPDPRWNNDALRALGTLHGSDFEAVDAAGLAADPNSGRVS